MPAVGAAEARDGAGSHRKRRPRGHDDPAEDHGPSKRGRLPGPYTFKVLCSDPVVSALIGKGGGALRELQEETGAKVDFSARGSYFPSSKYRVVTVRSADREAVFHVLENVIDRVADAARNNDEESAGRYESDCRVVALLARYATGSVLGRGGEDMRRLQADTNCYVEVEKLSDIVVDGHQRVEIRGGAEEVKRAMHVVCEKVQDEVTRDWFAPWAAQDPVAACDNGGSNALAIGGNRNGHREERHSRGRSRGRRRPVAPEVDQEASDAPNHDDLLEFRRHCPMDDRAWEFFVASEGPVQAKVLQDFQPKALRHADEDYSALVLSFTASVAKRFQENPAGFLRGLESGASPPARAHERSPEAGEQQGLDRQSGGLDALSAVLKEAPRRHLDVDYLISCDLPADQCDPVVRCLDAVMNETHTTIELTTEDADDMKHLAITGYLPDIYAAHVKIMMAFNNGQEEATASSQTADKVRMMQDQITLLQAQLEDVKKTTGGGGNRGGGKGKGKSGA